MHTKSKRRLRLHNQLKEIASTNERIHAGNYSEKQIADAEQKLSELETKAITKRLLISRDKKHLIRAEKRATAALRHNFAVWAGIL